jgi:uncharacterized membrane protein
MEVSGLNLKDPESMNALISGLLRYGVILSAIIIGIGTILMLFGNGTQDISTLVVYNPNTLPHGNFDPSLGHMLAGLAAFNPQSIVELGVLVLLATPAARVLLSVLLFTAEGDRTYAYITVVVLALLLFSMLVTPYIPGFNG